MDIAPASARSSNSSRICAARFREIRGWWRYTSVRSRALRLPGLKRAPDYLLARHGQHLDGHIIGNQVVLDQAANEFKFRVVGRRIPHLDFLKTDVHQHLEKPSLSAMLMGAASAWLPSRKSVEQKMGACPHNPAPPSAAPLGRRIKRGRVLLFGHILSPFVCSNGTAKALCQALVCSGENCDQIVNFYANPSKPPQFMLSYSKMHFHGRVIRQWQRKQNAKPPPRRWGTTRARR